MKLTISMPWEKDLSVNHMRYGAGGGYRKKEHVQAWMQDLMLRAWFEPGGGYHQMHFMSPRVKLPVRIAVDFRFPDKRKRDTHNYFKVVCDPVAEGLEIDDKDIRISTGTIEIDRDNPGFTITVEDERE